MFHMLLRFVHELLFPVYPLLVILFNANVICEKLFYFYISVIGGKSIFFDYCHDIVDSAG